MTPDLQLTLLSSKLAVCRLSAEAQIPDWAYPGGELLAIVRTRDELSVVCEQRFVPPQIKAERDWRALKVQGPLDFSQVGVLAALALPLAQAGVSIFAISTFDTDYVLVKDQVLGQAVQILRQSGITIST
jgi:uncharacterized protein